MGNWSSRTFTELTPAEREHFFQARQILCGTRVDEIHHNNFGSEVMPLVSPTVDLAGHIAFTF
jgi:hypothetical protein